MFLTDLSCIVVLNFEAEYLTSSKECEEPDDRTDLLHRTDLQQLQSGDTTSTNERQEPDDSIDWLHRTALHQSHHVYNMIPGTVLLWFYHKQVRVHYDQLCP